MRKKQNEPLDDSIFKTTITFKGTAKNLVSKLGYSKSAVVNALITDAIKSGKIVDYLAEHFSDSSIEEMLNRSVPVRHQADTGNQEEMRTNASIQHGDTERRGSLKSKSTAKTNQNKPKENSDGYDF